MNIRRRILIPMIVLTISCSIAVLVSSILLFNRELDNAMRDKINVAVNVVTEEIADLKNKAFLAAIAIAKNTDLIEAVLSKDREKIVNVASSLNEIAPIDYGTVLDAEGVVIIRTHEPDFYGDNMSHLPHVRSSLEGNTAVFIMQGVTVLLGVSAGAPIYDNNQNFIGIISVGFRLNNQEFVHRMSALTGCEISIFRNDELISSTVTNAEGIFVPGIKADETISRKVLAGETIIGNVLILGKDTLASYTPLYGENNVIVGMIFVGFYTEEETKKIFLFITNGVLITLAVFVFCFILARFISGTIELQLNSLQKKLENESTML